MIEASAETTARSGWLCWSGVVGVMVVPTIPPGAIRTTSGVGPPSQSHWPTASPAAEPTENEVAPAFGPGCMVVAAMVTPCAWRCGLLLARVRRQGFDALVSTVSAHRALKKIWVIAL